MHSPDTMRSESPPALPLVSIVTPSMNQVEFIAETIRTVLEQDYPTIEYLVVDGGSTDGTVELLRGLGDRVRWTSGPDAGQSDAINRGFSATSGEIIAWLNADDRYVQGAIRTAAEAFAQDPSLDLVYGQAVFIDRSGASMGPSRYGEPWDLASLINRVNFVVQPAAFFRRAAFEAAGGLDVNLHYVMDYDLWLRLGSRGGVRYIPEVFAEVRMYPETKTSSGGLPRFEEMERMIRRYGRRTVPADFEPEILDALTRACRRSLKDREAGAAVRQLPRLAAYGFRVAGRRTVRRLRRTVRGTGA